MSTSLVLADTITPVMVANYFYLLILNALIGWIEGVLLRRFFNGGKRAVRWMIPANYLSAWVGIMLISLFLDPRMDELLGPRPIERIYRVAGLILLCSFAITIVLETGFVYMAIQRERRSLGRTLLASVAVNVVSYAIICLWFINASFTLPGNAKITRLADMGSMANGTLYWVDKSDQVCSRDLSRDDSVRWVANVAKGPHVFPYQLTLQQGSDPNRAMMSVNYSDGYSEIGNEPPTADWSLDVGSVAAFPADFWEQDRILRKNVLDERPQDKRQTTYKFDWYRNYLDTETSSGVKSNLIVGLAGYEWEIANPTVLPDDKVVFEWDYQIMIFDPATQRLAFVASGSCPAFVPAASSR